MKETIREIAEVDDETEFLFAASSAQLLRVGLGAMLQTCNRIMTLDTAWPDYRKLLEKECSNAGKQVVTFSTGKVFAGESSTKEQFVEGIVKDFKEHRCDGLFMPAVTNLGVRLPYREVLQSLRSSASLKFVILDGAQDFRHVPPEIQTSDVDFYMAGCHKWVQAYLPMRIAICCGPKTRGFVKNTSNRLVLEREIDDPLLRFTSQLESGEFEPFTETANLLPLISCAAAVSHQRNASVTIRSRFQHQLNNAKRLDSLIEETDWNTLNRQADFRSGIVLLEHQSDSVRRLDPEQVRQRFCNSQVIASAYENGITRLSLPTRPWTLSELRILKSALKSFDQHRAGTTGGRQIRQRVRKLGKSKTVLDSHVLRRCS